MKRAPAVMVSVVLLAAACNGEKKEPETVMPEINVLPNNVTCVDGPGVVVVGGESIGAYEDAINLELIQVSGALLLAAQTSLVTTGTCAFPLAPFQDSPVPVLGPIAHAMQGRGTIEPAFGCDLVAQGGPSSTLSARHRDLLRYWIIRVPHEDVGEGPPPRQDAQRLRLSLRLRDLQGLVREAAPAPRVLPPNTEDPWVGSDAEDRVEEGTACGTQWYLHSTRVVDAWSSRPGPWPIGSGSGPIVAVLDFGFQEHSELSASLNMKKARNACDGTANVNWGARAYHGTAVAGLLASSRDGVGIVGVAPGVEVWPVQGTCDVAARIEGDPWATGIEWVLDQDSDDRRKVILLEVEAGLGWDIEEANGLVRKAVNDAKAENVVVVVAAGNGNHDIGKDRDRKDIEETGSILVGATDYGTKQLASFSNYGARVTVSAPGDGAHDLTLSDKDGVRGYVRRFGGTSGAAPKVAGVVALMLAENDRLTPQDVRDILGANGDPLVKNGLASGRSLDALAAVNEARRRRDTH